MILDKIWIGITAITVMAIIVMAVWIAIPAYIMRKTVQALR